jgi:hypothetical protein
MVGPGTDRIDQGAPEAQPFYGVPELFSTSRRSGPVYFDAPRAWSATEWALF